MTTSAARAAALVRGFAAFDLLVTACLAIPPLARRFLPLLFAGDSGQGFGSLQVEFQPVQLLFVNLAGVLGVMIAWIVAALAISSRLPAKMKRYHLAKTVGHYGIFNGSKWRNQIAPVVEDWIARHD